jgi:DNA-binding NarL/FixJ family response regulator
MDMHREAVPPEVAYAERPPAPPSDLVIVADQLARIVRRPDTPMRARLIRLLCYELCDGLPDAMACDGLPIGALGNLTARQRQVFDRIARGVPTKQIARELDIGIGTIKIHVAAILRAYGATTRGEAVHRALHGKVTP